GVLTSACKSEVAGAVIEGNRAVGVGRDHIGIVGHSRGSGRGGISEDGDARADNVAVYGHITANLELHKPARLHIRIHRKRRGTADDADTAAAHSRSTEPTLRVQNAGVAVRSAGSGETWSWTTEAAR